MVKRPAGSTSLSKHAGFRRLCVAAFSVFLALGATERSPASAFPTAARGSATTQASPRVPPNVWIGVGGDPVARALRQARGFVACVRRHGVRNLPNPKVVGNEVYVLLPPGVSRSASSLKRAERACKKLLAPQGGGSTHVEGP